MRKFILKHRFLFTGIISVIAALGILMLSSGQEQEFSRYGLHDYKSGLQKIFNICKADPNVTVVAYYKMEGIGPGIIDLSGKGHDLTASGSPTYQQPDYLNLNRAILFTPGTSDYFYCNDHPDFDLNGSEVLDDPGLESWTGDVPDYWAKSETGSSTVTDDAVTFHGGAHSAKFTVDAPNSNVSLYQEKALEANTLYTVEFWYKTEADKTCQALLQNLTTNETLKSDGTWASGTNYFTSGLTNVAWAKEVKNFVSDTATTYKLLVRRHSAASSVFNIDDLSLTKAYDCVIWVIAKTSDSGNSVYITHKIDAGNTGYALYKTGSNDKLTAYIRDAATQKLTYSNAAVNDGNYHLFKMAWDRSDKSHMLIDGVLQTDEDDISGLGDITNAERFTIGADRVGTNSWDGGKAEILIIKGAPLPDWVMSSTFVQNAYNWAMGWPLNVPRETE